jgi:hypothetical protein
LPSIRARVVPTRQRRRLVELGEARLGGVGLGDEEAAQQQDTRPQVGTDPVVQRLLGQGEGGGDPPDARERRGAVQQLLRLHAPYGLVTGRAREALYAYWW